MKPSYGQILLSCSTNKFFDGLSVSKYSLHKGHVCRSPGEVCSCKQPSGMW